MKKDIRVLVFGATGTGKTSVCNELSGLDRPANDSATGVTFDCFEFPPYQYDGFSISITDTVGLNESEKGTVSPQESIEKLVSLVRESKAGYHLLIHVMRASRITKDHHDNYDFFVNVLTERKIPCVLVVTGCENHEPIEGWAEKYKHIFSDQGFAYSNILSTCFQKGGPFESGLLPLRELSARNLQTSIIKYHSEESIAIYVGDKGFFSKIKDTWNWFCRWLEKPNWQMGVNEKMLAFLLRLKFPKKMAEILATGIKIKAGMR